MIEREAQIRALFPMVKKIARRISHVIGGVDLDDLVGDGSVGLIRAVDSFDPCYGLPIEQYARRVVVGAMLNGIRRLDPVSERVRRTLRQAERERYAIASVTGVLPSMREMEGRVPGLRRARTEAHRGTPLSLDAPLIGGEKLQLKVADEPESVLVSHADRMRVHHAVAKLPPRLRRIVVEHYFAERSLRALSNAMSISPQRVSQLHVLAIGRLRRGLNAGT